MEQFPKPGYIQISDEEKRFLDQFPVEIHHMKLASRRYLDGLAKLEMRDRIKMRLAFEAGWSAREGTK